MTSMQRQLIVAIARHVGYKFEDKDFYPGIPHQFDEEATLLLMQLLAILFESLEPMD